MTLTETPPETTQEREVTRPRATLVEELLGSGDHTIVGRVYVFLSLLMGVVLLGCVAVAGIDVGAGTDVLDPSVVSRFSLNVPFGLLLAVAMPLMLGLAISVVPLQVGSPSIAFPRAAGLSLWAWFLGSIFFVVSMLVRGGFGGSSEKLGQLGLVSIGLMSVALMVGSVCVATTVLSLRTAGQKISDIGHFSFSMLVASTLWILTLSALVARIVFVFIQHPDPVALLDEYGSLTWVFLQPAIFVALIPVLGIIGDTFSTMTGQAMRFHGMVQGAIGALGLLSFGAWAQTAGSREIFVWVIFGLALVFPIKIAVLASAETLRHGKPAFGSPLLFAAGAATLALLGSLMAFLIAGNTIGEGDIVSVDYVALNLGLFYLVIGAVIVGGIGGMVLWSSKVWDRPFEEKLALPVAALAPLGVILLAAGPIIAGFATPSLDATETLMLITGIGAILLVICALDGLGLIAMSARAAMKSSDDSTDDADDVTTSPWSGGTLEWAAASPPVPGNFPDPIVVADTPYPLFASTEKGDS